MVMPHSSLLRIGQLQALSQVPIKTIRYYEELGLIQAAERTGGGFRLFDPEVVMRLAFIKRSQQLGLSLAEIGEILQIHDQGQLPCQKVQQKLKAKVQEIDEKIQQLTLLRSQLTALLTAAQLTASQATTDSICPIIEAAQPAASVDH